jgi:uncharacterized DUF497 family protein
MAILLVDYLTKRYMFYTSQLMKFEYDPAKSAGNKTKHGIDFEEAQAIWKDVDRLEALILRPGERRYLLVGLVGSLHWTAIITYRDEVVRIISVRCSRHDEVKRYEEDKNI